MEEPVANLTEEGDKVNTSSVRGDTHAGETTESSISGLKEEQLRATSLEARRNAHKAVERLTPEERKAISQMGVPVGRAMEILEEIENADETKREAEEATEAAKSGLTKDQIVAMGLEAQEKARKAVEELTPEERKALRSYPDVPVAEAVDILEEIENADQREGEAEEAAEAEAEAEAEAAKSKIQTTGKDGRDEQDKASRDARCLSRPACLSIQ